MNYRVVHHVLRGPSLYQYYLKIAIGEAPDIGQLICYLGNTFLNQYILAYNLAPRVVYRNPAKVYRIHS